ncbi:MAG: hypothetical protein [Wendovervirus sonii]|uniref:Uncharacterized protein n=1 Tax=phage Lak_Megaphage_Sonny TaxID=3109229 RepID=A0ABZ0Z6A5_9CAUD|nr:MAG: hypothetical protein [phage Lak_Megaphage_Sonny]
MVGLIKRRERIEMKILILYVLGVLVTGIIFELLYMNESFYEYRIKMIHEIKREKFIDNPSVNDISDDEIINMDIFLSSLWSFLGLITIIVSIINWYGEINKNK